MSNGDGLAGGAKKPVEKAMILVVALAAVGLATITSYLDLVLLPALATLIIVTWISYKRYARTRG